MRAPLKQAEDFLLRSSLSSTTITAYQSAFNSYSNFVQQFFLKEQCLPPSIHHLSAFLAHCYLKGFAAATTRTLVSSLSFIFQLGSYTDITQHFICKKMLQGFSKAKPSADSRLPITPSILQQIVNSLQFTTKSDFLRKLFKAMFVLAFCAFLRIGEITKTSSPVQHFLLFSNVTLGSLHNKNFIDITIPHFKHSKSNNTTLRIYENLGNLQLCPYQSLLNYLHQRRHKLGSEPLFSFMDGAPVSRAYFSQQLKEVLAFCNLNFQQFHTHSFRIGAASTAAALGFSELQIQTMGWWHSTAFKKYIRIPTLKINSIH